MIDEPHIDLTTDDLLYLVNRIGAERPVGLDEAANDVEPPPEVREWLQNATERNLRARGILDVEGQPNAAVAEIVATTGSPGLIVSISTQRGRVVETAVLAAVPDLAVVHTPLAPGVHRLTPIATVEVVDRVRDLVSLAGANGSGGSNGSDTQAGSDDALRIDLTSLDPVTTAAQESTTAAAAAAREAGLTTKQAEALAELLADRDATHLVTVMHRSPDLHMGVVSWWSSQDRGLWQVQSVPGSDGEQLVLTPVTAPALLDAVRSHLPGVLSSPA
jgi:hypothetical protein